MQRSDSVIVNYSLYYSVIANIDYDWNALLRKARHPVEGEQPITSMTVCYLLMSVIIILLIIIYVRITNFIKHYNTQLHEIYLYILKNGDFIQRINEHVDYIYSVSHKAEDILKFHIKDTLIHLMFDTDRIIEKIDDVTKCCKEDEAKFGYIITTLKHLSTNKTKKATKPKTAKSAETTEIAKTK